MKKLIGFLKKISIDCYMVCLYFACLPFTVVETPLGSLLKLITMPVVAVLGLKLFVGKRKPLAFNSVQLIYSLYMVYVICGLFLYRSEDTTVITQDMLLAYAVLMLMTMRQYTEDERQMIESAWIAVGIACTYLIFTSSAVINEFESRAMISVFGYTEDPNQFCAYFIVPVMVSVKRIMERRKTLPLYVLLVILMLYSVLRTGSRGGMIGILAGIAVSLFIAVKSFKAKIGMVAVAIVCVFIVVFVVFPLLPEDIQQRYNVNSVVEDNAAGRFDIWIYLLNYITEKPARIIYGSGILSTYPILEGARLETGSGVAHNQFLQVFNDQGIIGLALFLILIACCFLRNVKKQPYYSCAFVAIMAFSMSLTMYVFKPYINIMMMCAMTFAQSKELGGDKNEIPDRT